MKRKLSIAEVKEIIGILERQKQSGFARRGRRRKAIPLWIMTFAEIADTFGVSRRTISNIYHKKIYQDVWEDWENGAKDRTEKN